jgi:hypothetical protein
MKRLDGVVSKEDGLKKEPDIYYCYAGRGEQGRATIGGTKYRNTSYLIAIICLFDNMHGAVPSEGSRNVVVVFT